MTGELRTSPQILLKGSVSTAMATYTESVRPSKPPAPNISQDAAHTRQKCFPELLGGRGKSTTKLWKEGRKAKPSNIDSYVHARQRRSEAKPPEVLGPDPAHMVVSQCTEDIRGHLHGCSPPSAHPSLGGWGEGHYSVHKRRKYTPSWTLLSSVCGCSKRSFFPMSSRCP